MNESDSARPLTAIEVLEPPYGDGPAYAFWQRQGVPEALYKAFGDKPFSYALQLRTGVIIEFEGAYPGNPESFTGWIHLAGVTFHSAVARGYRPDDLARRNIYADEEALLSRSSFIFDRGLDIRLADIVWVADAPYGS